nr:hypothetical protein [uncultured Rhodopila sp.]
MTRSAISARAAWWAALAALCLVLVAPLLVCDVPPLIDYPNHLARLFVLASLPGDAELAKFYGSHWSVIPNLALDLAGPPLMQVLPVYDVGRLLIAVAVLLPVLGTIAYASALGGRWWALGVGLVAWNNCLLYGFLNFSIGIGLALLLAAVWLRWRETQPNRMVAIATFGALALFACHLMGLVFFAVLIGGAELFRVWTSAKERTGRLTGQSRLATVMDRGACPQRRPGGGRASQGVDGGPAATMTGGRASRTAPVPVLREALRRGLVLCLVLAAPALLYAASDLSQLGGDAAFLPYGEKLLQLAGVFSNYLGWLDAATASVAIGLPMLWVLTRHGRFPGVAAVPMSVLFAAFLAAPYAWKGTYHLDTRLAVMLDFMLFAGFVPKRWPRGPSVLAAAAIILLFAARMAVLTTAWAAHQTDIDDIRRVLEPVRPGQAVYVAAAVGPNSRSMSDGSRTDIHLGALALIERRAWWPFEFDNVSQQPLQTRPPYSAMAGRVGDLPDAAQAATADVCGFDYVLLTGAGAAAALPPERFRLLRRSGFAALYGIARCEP